MQWFRFYADVLNDPKVQSLDPPTFKMWINLLCVASQNDGYIPVSRNVSWVLRETEETFHCVSQVLFKAGLLGPSDRADMSFRIHSWEKRQYKSDTSTERVKRFRNGKRNVSETPPEQNRTEQNRTETDTPKTPIPLKNKQTPLTPAREGVGVLKKIEGLGVDPVFRIEHLLTDEELIDARMAANGWDLYALMRTYDEGVNNGKRERPRIPSSAFIAWIPKYTKGKRP